MPSNKTTFSIEVHTGGGVQANAYGVRVANVREEVHKCLDLTPLHFLADGIDIQIRKEK